MIRKMKYTPIPPINYIERVTEKTKSLFVLAQLWDIKEYQWAIEHAKLDLVVLDNGAYENELVSDERLLEVASQIAQLHPKAQIYTIIPDILKCPKLSLKRTEMFCKQWTKQESTLPDNIEFLGVIQVEPEIGEHTALLQTLEYAKQLKDVTSNYGLPLKGFAIPIWFYRQWNSRDKFGLALRIQYQDHMYIHALGLDSLHELRQLQFSFDSFDTSMPFTLAYYGKRLKNVPVLDKSVKRRLNIERVPLKQLVPENDLYMENLEELLRVIQ